MHFQRLDWNNLQQQTAASFAVKVSLVVMFGLLFMGVTLGVNARGAHAQSSVGNSKSVSTNKPPVGHYNPFSYPQCTWWADERYHELHGVYVPWTTNANAWQWTTRAYQFGWQVSGRASNGAIIDLQPWVQGAYGYGHVGVVEKVYGDGSVLASSTNWGSDPYHVTYVHFYPGTGVTFIQW